MSMAAAPGAPVAEMSMAAAQRQQPRNVLDQDIPWGLSANEIGKIIGNQAQSSEPLRCSDHRKRLVCEKLR